MNTERIEEILLIATGVLLLTFTLPFSLQRNIAVTAIIAVVLMALLILRSIAWHRDGITPFDGIMVIGVGITIAYLASFAAFSRNPLNGIVLLLFACFYALLAVMLYQHRFMPAHPRVRHLRTWRIVPKRSAKFKQGMEPIAERPPRWYKRVFARKARRPSVEPLAEHPPRWYNRTVLQGTARSRQDRHEIRDFRKHMEPLPEITPEHLRRLGVYDAEPRRKRS